MSLDTDSKPGDVDPRTINPDKGIAVPEVHALTGPQYRPVKCYNKSTGKFVGYLSTRDSQSTAIGVGSDYPPALCYWMEKNGARYLAKETTPNDRCLGVSDGWYACWSLQQARNMGYFTNVIHNPDGTLSPGTYPERYLAGPYERYGIDWTWWAPKGHSDILVCELDIASAPTWENWSGNLKHVPASDGVDYYYYYTPTNLVELKTVLEDAKERGNVTIRVSGQRHSQTPLVIGDNRNAPPTTTTQFLVDMSCYIDVGNEGVELGPGNLRVTVNPGIREDALDAFLTRNNLMLNTVTAGGFFSIGGMTAVDVHGGTVEAPIFAETASAFTILGADGNLTTIDAQSPSVNGWSPLQFARVSLGGLGIVTRITLDVLPRPYATTLNGEITRYLCKDEGSFVAKFTELVAKHDRMEVFYTPYAAAPNLPFPVSLDNFLVLSWDVDDDPGVKTPNSALDPTNACTLAGAGEFGAPLIGGLSGYAVKYVRASQYYESAYSPLHFPPIPPSGFAAIAMDVISSQADEAKQRYSDLWLTASAQVIFMSYFIEMPALDAAGFQKVWNGLKVVADRVIQDGAFHISAPMEFRIVKSGNSAMSGCYSTKDTYFINLDLIGWIEAVPASDYPPKLLQFFADVERDWVAMGGFPHNGKMYGFYDPTQPGRTHTAPFNPNFLAMMRQKRGAALQAYKAYRKSVDPNGLFYNTFLRQLLGD